jgi:hypothetical protein
MRYTFDDHTEFATEFGEDSLDEETATTRAEATNTVFRFMGLRHDPDPTSLDVGVNFKGKTVYSDARLANDSNIARGSEVANMTGMALGAMGAFADTKEASRFVLYGEQAQDKAFHDKLDSLKAAKDLPGFVAQIGGDRKQNGFTSYKLFENWNNLSPAQKSIGIASAGMQGFTFDDGQTFATKKLTPSDVAGVPGLTAAEGLKLAGDGINVSPAVKKWGQYAALQDTLFTARSGSDVVSSAHSMGVLGFGLDGRAVPVDERQLSLAEAQLAPQYGIGAVLIPSTKGIPAGFVAAQNFGAKILAIPKENRGSVFVNTPEVASQAAGKIYQTWGPLAAGSKVRQDRGTIGGSALAGGLDQMTQSNPYALGAMITADSLRNTLPKKGQDYGDLAHSTYLTGISLQRLLSGKTTKEIDQKAAPLVVEGEFTAENYDQAMRKMRSTYAENGISSKEIGYQLANQGYAEGRFTETEVAGLQRSLDLVFDDSFTLAQKLATGKQKGLEIAYKRAGATNG